MYYHVMVSWFKQIQSGALPSDVRAQLEKSGIQVLAEQVRLTVIFRNFKAPGKRYSHRRSVCVGSFAISKTGLVGFAGRKQILDLPFDDKRFKLVTFAIEEKFLAVSFHPGLFHGGHEGEVEFRFYLPDLKKTFALLKSNGAGELIDKNLAREVVAEVKQAQDAINEEEWNNLKNWIGPDLCALYLSKKDCRIWVPKKIPSHGWTINVGSPAGIVQLVLLVIVFLVVVIGSLYWVFSLLL